MDQVREVMRLRHYSLSTERSYCDWIRRYTKFHQMRSRADLDPAEPKIEAFLSDLAINGHVAVSTQNQAFNSLLFLYHQVLHQRLRNIQAALRLGCGDEEPAGSPGLIPPVKRAPAVYRPRKRAKHANSRLHGLRPRRKVSGVANALQVFEAMTAQKEMVLAAHARTEYCSLPPIMAPGI